ncbi:MAG: competence/damage-inducible protein A [Chitinophagaceae bacterium]|nr:competence/damage-inducible protein A [Chitinophagaceae bacterium]
MSVNATIVTIGDELLIGQVIDTNSAWMGQELSRSGIDVIRRFAVGDEKKEIISALDAARSISDIILITGGLGPTKDDITKHTLCEYFNSTLVFDEAIYEMVKGFFDRFKRPMPESNRGQAEVPDNCIPIKNYNGTAPGMWFDIEGKVFVSMPGVPWEMKLMMKDFVVPRLTERFETPHIIHKTILTQGIGESLLAERISDIENDFPPGFKLAYLPYLSSVRLRISAHGDDVATLQHTIDELSGRLHERIGEYIWGYDDDKLEAVVGKILLDRHKTLSTAESCTGGLIAYRLASVAGASEYYYGSVVSYSNTVKKEVLGVRDETLQKSGAVSEETVREMVTGLLSAMKTDYAIAVSGIAGPDGGTPEKPVGTTWIAVADREKTVTRHFHFPGNRERNMDLAAINALSLLRKFMLGTLKNS